MTSTHRAKIRLDGLAVFSNPDGTYHADRCKPLCAAVRRGEVTLAALARRGYPGWRLPSRMLSGICSVGFWDAVGAQRWGLDWHRNEGIELTYLARGRTAFSVDNEDFYLKSGQITITRPWQCHRVGNPNIGPSRLFWIILDVGVRRPDQTWLWPEWLMLSPPDLERLTTLLRHNEQPVWQASDEIGPCFEKLAGLVQAKNPLSVQTRLLLHLNQVFVVLREMLETKTVKLDARLASSRRTVELFLTDLPQHLDQPWSLPEMAAQCGLGSSAFAEHCCQITNMPPSKYLVHCRVEAAKQMLCLAPERSITDIAFDCGFESSQYLATVFRRITGQTPREFRRREHDRKSN